MKVKILFERSAQDLEESVNSWLAANPGKRIHEIHFSNTHSYLSVMIIYITG